jgi:hypothetical protein
MDSHRLTSQHQTPATTVKVDSLRTTQIRVGEDFRRRLSLCQIERKKFSRIRLLAPPLSISSRGPRCCTPFRNSQHAKKTDLPCSARSEMY